MEDSNPDYINYRITIPEGYKRYLEPVKNYDNGEYERLLAAYFSYFSARTRRVRPSK